MKTLYTTLPVYNRLEKQCYHKARGESRGHMAATPCPRYRLPSMQWNVESDNPGEICKVELIGTSGLVNSISSWTNSPGTPYGTFTSSGANITSAVCAGAAIAYTNNITVRQGERFLLTINLTLNSGSAPTVEWITTTGTLYSSPSPYTLVNGYNYIMLKCIQSGVGYIKISNGAASNYSATFDLKGSDITDEIFAEGVYAGLQLSLGYFGWTNAAHTNDYDTFTKTGTNITSAIKLNAPDPAYATSTGTFNITTGDFIHCPCVLTLVSGSAPELVICDSGGNDISNVVTLTNGVNYPILVATDSDAASVIKIRNTVGEVTSFALRFFAIGPHRLVNNFRLFTPVTDDYFQYKGGTLLNPLPLGLYYLKMTSANGYIYYSDWFEVNCIYPNLIDSFTNVNYDTFSSNGSIISSAIDAAGGFAITNENLSVIKGETIIIVFTLTLNSGQLPDVKFGATGGLVISETHTSTSGVNTLEFTITDNSNVGYLMIQSTAATNFSTSEILVMRKYSEDYYRIDFDNDCDLGVLLYQDSFTQSMWFKSEAMEMDFPLEEEGGTDGYGKFVRTFGRQDKTYTLRTPLLSDFMVDVLHRLRMHDSVTIIDNYGDTGTMENIEVAHEWMFDDKYFAKADITFSLGEATLTSGCCYYIT